MQSHDQAVKLFCLGGKGSLPSEIVGKFGIAGKIQTLSSAVFTARHSTNGNRSFKMSLIDYLCDAGLCHFKS